MPTVKYLSRSDEWVVLESRRRGGGMGELVLMEEELSAVSATDVKNALVTRAANFDQVEEQALISAVPEGYFDEGPYRDVRLIWDGEALLVGFTHVMTWPEDADEEDVAIALGRVLVPHLRQSGSRMKSVEPNYSYVAPDLAFDIMLTVRSRGKTIQEIVDIADGAQLLCSAFSDGTVTRESAADLIRGGAGRLLEGQPEGSWLEAKSQEYDLTTTRGAISLAQAVARFCNAENGGLVVVGAQTKKTVGAENISRMRGVSARTGRPARYQQVINERVYPPPFALRIEQLDAGEERSFILIDIPAQPEELKPFLVHGAILLDGSTEGSFISIVQRRGEGSIPITAPMVHATLAAGRALLRGERRASDRRGEPGF
ncbi:hypothetical protein M3D75_03485 [Microbacterium enclense]|uniref:hypothetical protein n=1 Tax=Microbacterium enclense TaxID=993073 RepID=UPI0021A727A0|nr:hypothetical protein [Microbacterium enclense]MCT2085171.1 hypothetical protein [Microbacterium enclense]